MKFNMEKPITIDMETEFFDKVFNPLCKQIHYPKTEVNIVVINRKKSVNCKREIKDKYKFVFNYPENNDEVVGTEVYKIIEGELE